MVMTTPRFQRIVITGGRGFIGTHLVNALRTKGFDAESFDLQDGQNITDAAVVERSLSTASAVVHLAAWADLYEARRDPVEAVRVNVIGTAVVADTARRLGVRLVHASTACVYGNQAQFPTPEDATPNPTEIYAQTKLAAEQIVRGLVASHGLDAVIVRFPGVYGAGLRSALAVARFFERATADGVLEVHGDGAQTRSPIHVDDLVRGLVAVIERPEVGDTVNLGTPEEISALELAQRILTLVGRGRIAHVPQRTPNTARELIDWRRAHAVLDWAPRVSLEEGLRQTWAWWRETRPRTHDPLMQRFTEVLGHLVTLAPTPFNPAGRQAVREYLIDWLISLGFDTAEHGDDPASRVVIASRPGQGLRLGLCGHYDVEEAGDGWPTPPFELTQHGGRLLGRGVADNLGPLVLRLVVLEALGRDMPTAPLLWVLQGEEETGSPVAHALYPVLPWPQIDLWIEETGYFERDGAQRFLARDLDTAGQRVVDTLEASARQAGRGFEVHPRYLNKAFGQSRCPFLTHLVRGRPYVALGPNDPDSRIHHIGESLAPDNIRFAMAQFETLLTAARDAQTATETQV